MKQLNPYMLMELTGTNISHFDGFAHQIVAWMGEKCNFTYEFYFLNNKLKVLLRNLNKVGKSLKSTMINLSASVIISFEYALPTDQAYGSFENGSWNGMVGMLVRDVNYELIGHYFYLQLSVHFLKGSQNGSRSLDKYLPAIVSY